MVHHIIGMGEDGFIEILVPIRLAPISFVAAFQRPFVPFPRKIVVVLVAKPNGMDIAIDPIGTRTEPFAFARKIILRKTDIETEENRILLQNIVCLF